MSDDRALLDRALFEEFADLFDPDEMRDVIVEWYADVESALALIDDARRRSDAAAVARVAHGATSFAAVCEQLRARADSGAELTDEDIERVRDAAAATHRALSDAAGI